METKKKKKIWKALNRHDTIPFDIMTTTGKEKPSLEASNSNDVTTDNSNNSNKSDKSNKSNKRKTPNDSDAPKYFTTSFVTRNPPWTYLKLQLYE